MNHFQKQIKQIEKMSSSAKKTNKSNKEAIEHFENGTNLLETVDKDVRDMKSKLDKFCREMKKKVEEDSIRLAELEEKVENIVHFVNSYPRWMHETKLEPLLDMTSQWTPLLNVVESFDERLHTMHLQFANKIRELEQRMIFNPISFSPSSNNCALDPEFGKISPFCLNESPSF
jgi:hypothetical protein